MKRYGDFGNFLKWQYGDLAVIEKCELSNEIIQINLDILKNNILNNIPKGSKILEDTWEPKIIVNGNFATMGLKVDVEVNK